MEALRLDFTSPTTKATAQLSDTSAPLFVSAIQNHWLKLNKAAKEFFTSSYDLSSLSIGANRFRWSEGTIISTPRGKVPREYREATGALIEAFLSKSAVELGTDGVAASFSEEHLEEAKELGILPGSHRAVPDSIEALNNDVYDFKATWEYLSARYTSETSRESALFSCAETVVKAFSLKFSPPEMKKGQLILNRSMYWNARYPYGWSYQNRGDLNNALTGLLCFTKLFGLSFDYSEYHNVLSYAENNTVTPSKVRFALSEDIVIRPYKNWFEFKLSPEITPTFMAFISTYGKMEGKQS